MPAGNFLIVGKPFEGYWMVWQGYIDGWGSLGQEVRFSTREDIVSSGYLEEARRSADREEIELNPICIAHIPLGQTNGIVYHNGSEVAVDFTDDDLSPRQMRELGVL